MEKSIDELIQDLKNTDDFVKEEAKGLLILKGEEAIDSLIEALNGRSKAVKMEVASILGMMKNEKAIPALIKTLEDPSKLVRREASTALTQMGDAAVEPLKETLNSENWRVRGAAVWVLGSLKDKSVIPEIEKLLEDESAFVKSGAKYALDELNKL